MNQPLIPDDLTEAVQSRITDIIRNTVGRGCSGPDARQAIVDYMTRSLVENGVEVHSVEVKHPTEEELLIYEVMESGPSDLNVHLSVTLAHPISYITCKYSI